MLILLRGRDNAGESVATFMRYVQRGDGRPRATSISVRVGFIEPGDPFSNANCPLGQADESRTFALGSAMFDVNLCMSPGGGHTTAWRWYRAKVTDAELPPEQRIVELEGEALASVLASRFNHHNGCDSFHLRTPYAQYAASAADRAGCGPTVDEAPSRVTDFREPVTKYRIRRGEGPWQSGQEPCRHFLFKGPGDCEP